jgi:transposase-like protein
MTRKNDQQRVPELTALMLQNQDSLQPLVQWLLQEVLEQEMTEAIGAAKGERSEGRQGYRSGYYPRQLMTRVWTMELRVPQDRQGRFSTRLFERDQRSEKALVAALVEMDVQGVSTRKIKTITEELCGHEFSASAVSELNAKLDGELERFARLALEVEFPDLILDARYEKVREDGVIRSRTVLVAIGIDWEGRRQILAVEIAGRESTTSWREMLLALKQRGLSGVRLAISDDHAGLKRTLAEVLPEAAWQRCYVHFLRNALDHLPRKTGDDCLTELRWLDDRRDGTEVRQYLAAWIEHWQAKYPKLTTWVEEQIEETFTFYRLPQTHQKHLKSTNLLERFHQEIKRRSLVVRIFPNEASCLRLIRALPPSSTRSGSMAPATSTCNRSPISTKLNSNSPPKPHHNRSPRPAFAELDGHNPNVCGAIFQRRACGCFRM